MRQEINSTSNNSSNHACKEWEKSFKISKYNVVTINFIKAAFGSFCLVALQAIVFFQYLRSKLKDCILSVSLSLINNMLLLLASK